MLNYPIKETIIFTIIIKMANIIAAISKILKPIYITWIIRTNFLAFL